MVDKSRKPIRRFEDLEVWQDAQDLSVEIYKLTKDFPKEEIFGITSQIRRCSISVSANIAEGFGRKTNKDKEHFYHIAVGSLLETKSFVYLCRKLDYIETDKTENMINNIEILQKKLYGVLRYFNNHE